jgi:Tfp pilus assembly protein PilF
MKKRLVTLGAAVLAAACAATGCSRETPADARQATAHYETGAALINQRMYDRAVEEFDKAIEADPNYAQAYCDRGVAYYMKGESREAMRDFETAIEKDPTLGKAHFHKAMMLEEEGKTAEAIEEYEKFLRHSERSPQIYVQRANRRLTELRANTP